MSPGILGHWVQCVASLAWKLRQGVATIGLETAMGSRSADE
jgi:hypothetical protein